MNKFQSFKEWLNLIEESDQIGRSFRLTKAIGGGGYKDKYDFIKKAREDARELNERGVMVIHIIKKSRTEKVGIDIKKAINYLKTPNEISVSVKEFPMDVLELDNKVIILLGETKNLKEYYETDVLSRKSDTGEKYPVGYFLNKGAFDWDEAVVSADDVNWKYYYISDNLYTSEYEEALSNLNIGIKKIDDKMELLKVK